MFPSDRNPQGAYGHPSQPPPYSAGGFASQTSYFAIKSNMNSKCLDANQREKITLWDYHGGDSQLWYWNPNGLSIHSKMYPDKVLDLHVNDYYRDGWGKIYLHPFNNGTNQKWHLKGDRIVSLFKNLHLDIYANDTNNGASVGGYQKKLFKNVNLTINQASLQNTSLIPDTRSDPIFIPTLIFKVYEM